MKPAIITCLLTTSLLVAACMDDGKTATKDGGTATPSMVETAEPKPTAIEEPTPNISSDDTTLPTTKVFKPWPGADLSNDFEHWAGHYYALETSDCFSGFFMPPDAPTSIEESIFLSDAIVVAELVSVETGADPSEIPPRYIEFDSPGYTGVVRYTFDVMEYLKGEGDTTITAEAHHLSFAGELWFHPDRAMKEASEFLHLKSEQWHDRPMVLFLQRASDSFSSDYTFTDTDAGPFQKGCWDSHIYGESRFLPDSERNVAWYPALHEAPQEGVDGDDMMFLITQSKRWQQRNTNVPLREIRERILHVDRLAEDLPASSPVAECVRKRFLVERLNWSRWPTPPEVFKMEWRGDLYNSYGMKSGGGWGYDIVPVVAGDLSEILVSRPIDHYDDDPANGYFISWSFNRKVPKGTYLSYLKFGVPAEALENDPCPAWFTGVETVEELKTRVGDEEYKLKWVYTELTSPVGNTAWYHEAFFDPGTDGETHGFVKDAYGVLDPQPEGSSVDFTITDLTWNDGYVVMNIKRRLPEVMSDYHIIFENEASEWNNRVKLVLPFNPTTRHSSVTTDGIPNETYQWCVPERPWTAGDKFFMGIYVWPDVAERYLVSEVSCP